MNLDLLELADWFPAHRWPDAPCPRCNNDGLSLTAVEKHETHASESEKGHEAWEPGWISGYFTAVLTCGRASCREITVALGDWRVVMDEANMPPSYDWARDGEPWLDKFRVRSTLPALPIARVPDGCPRAVRESLERASDVVWTDPSAAANRLRVAIELLLDDRGVPRLDYGGKKRTRMTTHARINRLRKVNAPVADVLEAVKWVGNQGSHEGSLSTAGALEAAQILQHALELVYDDNVDTIQRRAREINKAKGLRRSRNAKS